MLLGRAGRSPGQGCCLLLRLPLLTADVAVPLAGCCVVLSVVIAEAAHDAVEAGASMLLRNETHGEYGASVGTLDLYGIEFQ